MKADLVNCHYCNKEVLKRNCKIIDAIKNNRNLYCDKGCSNLGRRSRPLIIRSKRIGTPSKLNDKHVELLKIRRSQGVNIAELIQVFKISKTSIYKYLK